MLHLSALTFEDENVKMFINNMFCTKESLTHEPNIINNTHVYNFYFFHMSFGEFSGLGARAECRIGCGIISI